MVNTKQQHPLVSNRTLPITLIAVASLGLMLIIVIALLMRPVADDYAYFSDSLIHNPLRFTIHYYLDWTGRSMQALWMASLYRVFGPQVVIYGTIVQTLFLAVSAIFCTYAFLRKTTLSQLHIAALGLTAAMFGAYMTPSLFDTNLWITSSTVYIGSLIGLFVAAGTIGIVSTIPFRPWHMLIVASVTFLAQLFSEPTSIIMIYLGVVALVLAHVLHWSRHLRTLSWTWLLSSLAGFAFMFFSPGTRTRQHELSVHSSLADIFIGSIHDLHKLLYIFTSYRIILILLAGLLLAMLFSRISTRYRLYGLVISIISAFAVPLSLFAATHYTMAGYTPLRALSVPVALFAICIAVAGGLALSWLVRFVPTILTRSLSIGFALMGGVALLATLHAAVPTLHAVALRADLYDNRESVIRQQIASQKSPITIEPLPMLLDSTDAVDMYYNSNTPPWLAGAFRSYYHIPAGTELQIDSQPEGYCVTSHNPSWFGTRTCKDIDE